MGLLELLFQDSWSKTTIASALLASFIFYVSAVAIHRLYFSRYAKFPGPKLAALTHGYMFYYDVIGGDGQYMYKIKDMHEEYNSPIIRISPDELHVNDPDFYDVLFAGAHTKRDKPPKWSQAFNNKESIFGTIHHDQHRVRRAALNPFFSPAALHKLEPLIQDYIDRIIAVFRRYQSSGDVIHLKPAFGAMTSDIIADYCFGVDENYTEAPGFNAVVVTATEQLTENTHIFMQAHWLPEVLDRLPEWLTETVFGPGMAKINEMKHLCVKKIKETMKRRGDFRDTKHRTIFHDLLDNPNLPESDKTVGRLWQEAQLLLAAGTVTTAVTISSAFVYLLLDPERLGVLMEELETAIPDITKPLKTHELEQLPYFNAVIQETLRLQIGVSHRLVRSAPNESLQLGDWIIPPDTAVSIHGPLIHYSPTIYPSPWSFIPERWLPSPTPPHLPPRPPGIPQAKQKYLVGLSKGTRQCLGLPLAHAELYMTIASVLRAFVRVDGGKGGDGEKVVVRGMRLVETDRRDTDMTRDMAFPGVARGRGDVRVVVEGV